MTSPLLTRTKMSDAGVLPRRSTSSDQRVKLADPAINVMNDFAREYPVTVDEDRQIDAALADMIRLGVRALLVVRERKVVGFITSYDIEGERPLQCMQRLNYSYRQDIQVGHVMTSWTDLQTLNWRAVKDASAGDLLEVFRETDLMHFLVVETAADAASCIRGLFSRTRLERQLGLPPAMSAKLRPLIGFNATSGAAD
ncbi:MAG: CBS domain-containing protein [Steroidobacteraceae bacterium]